MKKTIYFIFTALLFLFQNIQAQELQLYDANVKRWNAGQKRSGYSYDYNFRFKALKKLKKLEIKGVWIDTLFYETKTYINDVEQTSCFTLKKGEQLLVRTNVRFVPNEFDEYKSNYISCKNPMPKIKDKKFKALVYYHYKGKRRYHIISEIEKLPQINMP